MDQEEEDDEVVVLTAKHRPSILVSLSAAQRIALSPGLGDLELPASPGATSRSPLSWHPPRIGSPLFNGGSLFRRFSHSRHSIKSSLDCDDEITDQTDVFEVSSDESSCPQLPVNESQIAAFFESIGQHRKGKVLANLAHTWLQQSPDETCSDTGNSMLHVAARMEETKVLQALLALGADINVKNNEGDSPLHIAVKETNVAMVKCLVENNANTEAINYTINLNPLQCACLKLSEGCVKYLLKHGADHRVITRDHQSVFHLTCLSINIHLSEIREKMNIVENEEVDEEIVEDMPHVPQPSLEETLDRLDFPFMENQILTEEEALLNQAFPILKLLLRYFENSPVEMVSGVRIIEMEDDVATSPGTALHYFSAINFVEGVQTLLQEPFMIDPNMKNKNNFTPLLIASKENNFEIVHLLLEAGADPNCQAPLTMMTPLHLILSKFHTRRTQSTCQVVTALMAAGADPNIVNTAGEAPAHIVVQIQDLQMLACFLDYLSPEDMNIKDSTGDSMLHFAASCMDEDAIFKVMSAGAGALIMCRNKTCIYSDRDLGFEDTQTHRIHSLKRNVQSSKGSKKNLMKSISYEVSRIPLQEALKNGNAQNYFSALRRIDLRQLVRSLDKKVLEDFQRTHIVAATKEVRPDIVRAIFQYMKGKDTPAYLHRVRTWSDKQGDDETFSKTALEWAVENNDRLCTTEILHQEYECHKESKEEGLRCLRNQLTGDELLVWTIETFNMFYRKTWFNRRILPVFYTIPLIISYSSFIYDNYSDFELSYSYYIAALSDNRTEIVHGDFNITILPVQGVHISQFCPLFVERTERGVCEEPAVRSKEDYITALIFNVVCILIPLTVFAFMFAVDTLPFVENFTKSLNKRTKGSVFRLLVNLVFYFTWIIISIAFSPLYVLYVATNQVYYKYKHNSAKKKNKYRGPLQKFEYLWGIARTAESGFESCGQLLLQIWLLSFDILELTKESKLVIFNQAVAGIIHFVTFSFIPAGETEKSLAKVLMSIHSVVMCVAASYRTLKRGAVNFRETFFIYLSLLCQVIARILSFLMLYLYQRRFFPTIPIILSIHFLFVSVFKWHFERARHFKNGFLTQLVCFINIFASSLVYVRIVPIDKSSTARPESGQQLEHTTFLTQSLFFLLVLLENLLLSLVPLLLHEGDHCCVSYNQMIAVFSSIFVFCVLSWIFHSGYYKYYGHPWADINGPDITSRSMNMRYHFQGEEKSCTLYCGLCSLCDKEEEFQGICWINNGPIETGLEIAEMEESGDMEQETVEKEPKTWRDIAGRYRRKMNLTDITNGKTDTIVMVT